MNNEQKIELTGTVIFLKMDNGSKNEGLYPFLYTDRDHCQKLFFKGDNPFENTQLCGYDGKKVIVIGQMLHNKTFVIEKITEHSDKISGDGMINKM